MFDIEEAKKALDNLLPAVPVMVNNWWVIQPPRRKLGRTIEEEIALVEGLVLRLKHSLKHGAHSTSMGCYRIQLSLDGDAVCGADLDLMGVSSNSNNTELWWWTRENN